MILHLPSLMVTIHHLSICAFRRATVVPSWSPSCRIDAMRLSGPSAAPGRNFSNNHSSPSHGIMVKNVVIKHVVINVFLIITIIF